MQFYDSLGLPPRLSLDPTDLKTRFYDRSRQWHPDRFARASAADQEHSLQMTSILNDAFRTLRDPVSRAEYFLQQSGLEIAKEAPPELLEEVFELNMALEELREGDASARPQLVAAQQRFQTMLADADQELTHLFEAYDATSSAPATPASSSEPRPSGSGFLNQIRATLNRRRYVSNLVREVEKELNVPAAN